MSDTNLNSCEGGCACGGLRYRIIEPPMFVHCCHCSWCQRETGSAFVVNALIEASRVELLKGRAERVQTPTASGKGQAISRCPDCRVAVWSNYAGAGDAVHFLRVGTLDEPARYPPDIHIFTSTKLPWVALADGKPVMDSFYRYRDFWPADSFQRLLAAKD